MSSLKFLRGSKNIKPALPSHLHHPPFYLQWYSSLSGLTSTVSIPGSSPHSHLQPQPRLHKRTRSSNAATDLWRAREVGRFPTFLYLYSPPTLLSLCLSLAQTVGSRNPSWRRGYYTATTPATTTTTTAYTIRKKATAAGMSKGIMENSTSSGGVATVAAVTTNSTSPSSQKVDAGQDQQDSTPAPAPSEEPEEDLYTICTRLSHKVRLFLETDFSSELLKGVQRQTRISLGVIEEALRRYKYLSHHPRIPHPIAKAFNRLENLSISFNGGKDCLVLLILFLASLPPYLPPPSHPTSPTSGEKEERKINSVYVTTTYPFPQVDAFVQTCIRAYHLSLARYSQPMKSSFERYLQDNPNVQAIFVGTRRTDPHGELLSHFDVTDHGWPKFMRVHPVVDWGYKDVWGVCILRDYVLKGWR